VRTGWDAWNVDTSKLQRKNGLRMAIEGRLKWLGVIDD
jgi:hypothetical protein